MFGELLEYYLCFEVVEVGVEVEVDFVVEVDVVVYVCMVDVEVVGMYECVWVMIGVE